MYDNQAILKKVTGDNPKLPIMRVEIDIDGVKYKAGLWPWQRKDGSPIVDDNGNQIYKGKVERDTYKPKQATYTEQPKAEPKKVMDDIPF